VVDSPQSNIKSTRRSKRCFEQKELLPQQELVVALKNCLKQNRIRQKKVAFALGVRYFLSNFLIMIEKRILTLTVIITTPLDLKVRVLYLATCIWLQRKLDGSSSKQLCVSGWLISSYLKRMIQANMMSIQIQCPKSIE
jgi:predicted XRE-type DNA-binding protein